MHLDKAVKIVRILLKNSDLNSDISDIQELVFRECWSGKSYQEIAVICSYDPDYIKQIGAKLWKSLSQALNKKVTKGNIHSVISQYWQEQQLEQMASNSSKVESLTKSIASMQDWGDAIDVRAFFGREQEIKQCKSWIQEDRCQLITILGMGGIGKTAIASKLAKDIAEEFEYIIWRSLRNAPPFLELLTDLILFVSGQKEVNLPDSIDACLDCLMRYLAASFSLSFSFR